MTQIKAPRRARSRAYGGDTNLAPATVPPA